MLADRHIGEEEVVIDDDDVAFHGAATHFGNEAAAVVGAGLAEARFAARIELGPDGAGFGEVVDFDAVAGFGGLFPLGDGLVLGNFFEPGEDGLVPQRKQLVAAEIIRAAFHVADAQWTEQRLEERNIFEEELLLEILCAGGDDDAMASGGALAQGRQQIGQGFAGSGTGFDDEVALVGEGALDGLCHLQLAAAKFIGQIGPREDAAWREEIVQRWQRGGRLLGGGHATSG